MICEVCEQEKPIAELKAARYCGLKICDSCREAEFEFDNESDTKEEWSPVEDVCPHCNISPCRCLFDDDTSEPLG